MKRFGFPFMGKITGIISLVSLSFASCDFLDVVPDNVQELRHAFESKAEAETFLATCYSYLPLSGVSQSNIGMLAGDELSLPTINAVPSPAWNYIALGKRDATDAQPDFWRGSDWTFPLFTSIRDCNIFLENVEDRSQVIDLSLDLRLRWIAEVKFLKAYYHFFLLRMYGPIPLMKTNVPVDASPKDVMVARNSVDECFEYIVELLDESYNDLPPKIYARQDELGRITQPINRALKAKVLLYAASPLFNGNPDFKDFKNKDGKQLFNPIEDPGKWAVAADAAREAIESAHAGGHEMFYFNDRGTGYEPMSPEIIAQMSSRHAVCERWNNEIIWGLSGAGRGGENIQQACMALLDSKMNSNYTKANMAPTLKVIKEFYSKNGVPIEEDRTIDFSGYAELRTATNADKLNMEVGHQTARINFDRENRFYANVGFDGGMWLMKYYPNGSETSNYILHAKKGELGAGIVSKNFSCTGYFVKKLVHWDSGFGSTSSGVVDYAWPEIRLADLYLMYAEALNEAEGPVPDVHFYIDEVRKRAGLGKVEDSWRDYSKNPTKPDDKPGMREIIRRERLIELAFEGSRYWDLLRWRRAADYLNQPMMGWDISQSEAPAYYQEKILRYQNFVTPRDYFSPINTKELMVNTNLVQNPGWE